ncbi:MAG: multicopper oxidase family protein [Acidobacteria bacterium]|nr:multicopper oxidase family protein [Acidobacteriota bacterium]
MIPIKRRQFMRYAVGALVMPVSRIVRADPAANEPGLVELGIEAGESRVDGDSWAGWLYTYNSQLPGPVLEARSGDTVRIRLLNRLGEATNLHFHGLHVPPTGAADNGFLMVPPGEVSNYEFRIPANHPAGTFWYHPHVHESTARQVSRGLAGAILIRGDLDAVPAVAGAPEYILVLQDLDLDSRGYPREPNMMERVTGREGNLVTLSGTFNPTIAIAAGGWVRLRLINASASRFYRLKVEEHAMAQIASDGGPLPSPQYLDELLLAPGERAEVMVEGTRTPGAYRVLNLPYNRGGMGMMGAFRGTEVLASLVYDGNADRRIALPERLFPFDALPQPSRRRSFVLGQGMGMGMGMMGGTNFSINGRTYNPNRVDTQARLGDVEEWEFVNPSMMDHPMHIHTNSFQVIDASGGVQTAWKDVALVRAGSRVRVRMKFSDYAGRTFYHCHILDHEDLGMMGILEIQG